MKQKIADLINVIFGFRKFLAWLAVLLIAVIFTVRGLMNGAQFVDLMKTTFMGFVAGNGVEHIVSTVKEYINSKGQVVQAVDPAPTGDDVVAGDGK